MTLVVAVLELQRSRPAELTASEAIDDAQGALLTLARLYRGMYELRSSELVDLPMFLEAIGRGLRLSYLDRLQIRLSVVADGLAVPPAMARDIGLIVAELVGNAAKHAFSARPGTIEVNLSDCTRGLVCRVADDGSGCPSDKVLRSTGGLAGALRLAQRLGGWLVAVPEPCGGAAFELVVPWQLAEVATSA